MFTSVMMSSGTSSIGAVYEESRIRFTLVMMGSGTSSIGAVYEETSIMFTLVMTSSRYSSISPFKTPRRIFVKRLSSFAVRRHVRQVIRFSWKNILKWHEKGNRLDSWRTAAVCVVGSWPLMVLVTLS